MNAEERVIRELSSEEYDKLNKIVKETLEQLLGCADEHDINRDWFVKFFACVFAEMARTATFENYKV